MPTYKYLDGTGLERTLSKLKTYIDSQSGGGSDVKGAIIFDTTTLSVGNVVRARSITNPFHIYEQTVLESGPQIVMRVEPFEQWKICLLEYGVPTVKIETESTTALSVSVTVQGTNKSKHTVNSTDTDYSVSCISIVWNDERSAWVMTATADCTFNSNSYSNGDEIDVWGEDDVVELTVVGELQESIEIGGVYKTVDYGQTLFINVLDKTTLGGIQGILNAHQETELLNISDEVNITVNGSPWTMQIAKIDGSSHYVELVPKYVTDDILPNSNADYANRTTVKNTLLSFYSSIIESDRNLIKEKVVNYVSNGSSGQVKTINQKVWLPTRVEIDGTGPETGSRFPIFTTQANRVKRKTGGTAVAYMLAGCTYTGSAGYTDYVSASGNASYTNNATLYMLPCFRLTADS